MRWARMSLRKPSNVSPTTASDQPSRSAERAAIASRTTPTLKVFVMPTGVVSSPDSRTHSNPVSSPLPFRRWQPANSVAWPTSTPSTSLIALREPGSPSPIAMPRSRARIGTPYEIHPLGMTGGRAPQAYRLEMGATDDFFGSLASPGHVELLEKARGSVRVELGSGKGAERWLVTIDKGDVVVSHKAGAAD